MLFLNSYTVLSFATYNTSRPQLTRTCPVNMHGHREHVQLPVAILHYMSRLCLNRLTKHCWLLHQKTQQQGKVASTDVRCCKR